MAGRILEGRAAVEIERGDRRARPVTIGSPAENRRTDAAGVAASVMLEREHPSTPGPVAGQFVADQQRILRVPVTQPRSRLQRSRDHQRDNQKARRSDPASIAGEVAARHRRETRLDRGSPRCGPRRRRSARRRCSPRHRSATSPGSAETPARYSTVMEISDSRRRRPGSRSDSSVDGSTPSFVVQQHTQRHEQQQVEHEIESGPARTRRTANILRPCSRPARVTKLKGASVPATTHRSQITSSRALRSPR